MSATLCFFISWNFTSNKLKCKLNTFANHCICKIFQHVSFQFPEWMFFCMLPLPLTFLLPFLASSQRNFKGSRFVNVYKNQKWFLLCSQGDAKQDQSWAKHAPGNFQMFKDCVCACVSFCSHTHTRSLKIRTNTAPFGLLLNHNPGNCLNDLLSFHSVTSKYKSVTLE